MRSRAYGLGSDIQWGDLVDPAWVSAAAALATALVLLTGWMVKRLWQFFTKLTHFLDDYNGEPADPAQGKDERPGVMLRLQRLEVTAKETSVQVHINSGTTLRDAVQRTEANVEKLQETVNSIQEEVRKISGGGP
jgi:hypothetical protein